MKWIFLKISTANQGECIFRLCNANIVGFYYLFNCATCFGHMTIFKHTYFPRTYSIDNGSIDFLELISEVDL
jgi:hypothetical protein